MEVRVWRFGLAAMGNLVSVNASVSEVGDDCGSDGLNGGLE
jgi:hypothetical protein